MKPFRRGKTSSPPALRTGCLLAAVITAAIAAAGAGGCTDERPVSGQHQGMTTRKSISDVLRENTSRLMKVGGVVGVYEGLLGNGEPCITVMVKEERPGLKEEIPDSLGGYPVRLEIGGEIRPMR
jgi:hypothetical protein